MKRILPGFILGLPKELSDGQVEESNHGEVLKKSLIYSNQVLSQQVEKNKKKIKALKGVLNFIQSLPSIMTPEIQSLISTIPNVNSDYDFELMIVNEIHKYICKSKYFSIDVELKQLSSTSLSHYEKIQIEAKVYTSDSPSTEITKTMQGRKIIRGLNNTKLVYSPRLNKFIGNMKIQIREVSSHYINKAINLVIEPKGPIEHTIRPAVVRNIVIKAKEKTCQRLREAK